MSFLVTTVAKKVLSDKAAALEPSDPYYRTVTDSRGRTRQVKRKDVPPGLTQKEAAVLRKIRKRAHRLDKGAGICGWGFFIGLVPVAGDALNAGLNYALIIKPARTLDLPKGIQAKMVARNAVSTAVGFVPVVGDICVAILSANSRNAHTLEKYLAEVGAERVAAKSHGDAGSEDEKRKPVSRGPKRNQPAQASNPRRRRQ